MTAALGSRTARSGSVRDEALEHAFARREATAYEAAYHRFGGRLYATALRLLRNQAQAQDCVHDVMFRLWKRGDAYAADRGSLEAFLVVCVRNEALVRLRETARHDTLLRGIVPQEEYEMETDPIERQRIARAVAKLTVLQRQTIELVYFRSMTLNEAATVMKRPLGTLKSHLSSALRALRVSLKDEAGDA